MISRQSRSGIERKFLTSILWVGVIPMALALVSGYVLARENQKNAVRINLETAARVKADGLNLTLQGRLQRTELSARDRELIEVARAEEGLNPRRLQALLVQMKEAVVDAGDTYTDFVIYDTDGRLVASTRESMAPQSAPLLAVSRGAGARVVDFDEERFVVLVTAPVPGPDGGAPVAYLADALSAHEETSMPLRCSGGA